MPSSTAEQNTRQLTCPQLPLGVYREIAAHIRQVTGVDANLIWRSIESDRAAEFDYYQSQIAALQIIYTDNVTEAARQRVEEILAYYARRYSPWQDWEGEESLNIKQPDKC